MYWLFDYCKQSLNQLYHPSTHPSIHPHISPALDFFLKNEHMPICCMNALFFCAITLKLQHKCSKFSTFSFKMILYSFWNNQILIIIYKIDLSQNLILMQLETWIFKIRQFLAYLLKLLLKLILICMSLQIYYKYVLLFFAMIRNFL